MSAKKKPGAITERVLLCEKCAWKHGGPAVPQGVWLEVCLGCGNRTAQAFEMVGKRRASREAK